MKKFSEQPESKSSKRLSFEQSSGWYKYGRIPLKIYYSLECSTDDFLNEKIREYFK